MTFPDEAYDDLMERCDTVMSFLFDPADIDGRVSMGAIVRCADDGFMVVECGQQVDGKGFATVRRYDRFGEAMPVETVGLDGQVLITG